MILRLNPLLLVIVAIMGIASFVVAFRAFTSYHDAAEAFTQVEMQYVPDSFRWEDPAFETATATFRVVNTSSFPATLESFSVALNFDGAFAGSDYSRWIPINIPAGESRDIPVTFTITSNSIQAEGGTATLGYTGQLRFTFADFEEPLVFRFRGTIGQAQYEPE